MYSGSMESLKNKFDEWNFIFDQQIYSKAI